MNTLINGSLNLPHLNSPQQLDKEVTVLESAPEILDIPTPDMSVIELNDNAETLLCQTFFNYSMFCLILSVNLYICICTPTPLNGSIHGCFPTTLPSMNDNSHHPLNNINYGETDPGKVLNDIRITNIERLIIGQLNINSLRNKIDSLKLLMKGNIDILIITETKLDDTFPNQQFYVDGYNPPFRINRTNNAGGVIIYVRGDIPAIELKRHPPPRNIEGIFFEVNLRKTKWLVFGGYNPDKHTINNFLGQLGPILDFYMPIYDNFLLLGDFNSEMCEPAMITFCETYSLINLIKEPTCFKNPLNPSSIDLILTNRPRIFQNSTTVETGLSDHHMLTITVMRKFFQKQTPTTILYRNYKNFDQHFFRNELLKEIYNVHQGKVNCATLEKIVIKHLDRYAPIKKKYVRANNSPYMNKTLSKAVMNRSRLRNIFTRNPTPENKSNYNKYRNYCTGLFRKEKRAYYNNLDPKFITDNKKFWKTVKPLFSEKHFSNNKITLIEGEEIIHNDREIAEKFNSYFANVVENLGIEGFTTYDFSYNPELDYISNIVHKFKNHPSILKIKEKVIIDEQFYFLPVEESIIIDKINFLDKRKPAPFNNIPTKVLVENGDIFSPVITNMYNESVYNSNFPNTLKIGDITPVHKKDERTLKENYRPVSVLPPISKIFEKIMFDQLSTYIDKYLSPFLFGFRQGHSTQNCLSIMLEKWKKAMDSSKLAGGLLTDLSKAFDCLNHELLIAKLEAYGFNNSSLKYIYSYLSDRKQRTKVNNTLSEWCNVFFGVPQGSILGPLLFNIYINDIFLFVDKCNIANYADDTTPYTVDSTMKGLLNSLEKDINTLIKWFRINYLKLNGDKCQLLISNHNNGIKIKVDDEIIECKNSVKLLGITLDNKLNLNDHVSKLCKKAGQKLHALARVSNFMSQDKLRILMKAFIESQFGYCPLIWMFHNRTLNNRINRIHESALRLVYKDTRLSFKELLYKDNSFSIHHRNLQKLVTEVYKAKNNISPTPMKQIFQDREIPYDLRKLNTIQTFNIHSVYNGAETISHRGPKTWALVPDEIKKCGHLEEFKSKIKNWEPIGCECRLCKIYIKDLGFI